METSTQFIQAGNRSVGAQKDRMCPIDCLGSSCGCGLSRRMLRICVQDIQSASDNRMQDTAALGIALHRDQFLRSANCVERLGAVVPLVPFWTHRASAFCVLVLNAFEAPSVPVVV